MDVLTLFLAILAGASSGSYPVPIKHHAVLEARVHPLIFQCYKSFWVFVSGFLFLVPNAMKGNSPVFEFTWWGILSAMAWIPAGVCTIAAVPRIGMAMTILLNAGTASWLSFVVFWLLLDEQMVKHSFHGHEFYLAPMYLTLMLVGMSLLIAIGSGSNLARATKKGSELEELMSEDGHGKLAASCAMVMRSFLPGSIKSTSMKHFTWDGFLGVIMAVCAGICAALQAGFATIGRRDAMHRAGCIEMSQCPLDLQERFNSCGSWMASFGIGAAFVNSCFVLIFVIYCRLHSLPVPSPCFRVMWLPGSISSLLWCIGNFFGTFAVMRGGNSVVVPVICAVSIITSGSWGVFYYREVVGSDRITRWCSMATFTLMSMLLLSHERS